jgi:mannan polymerase complexes MNN9 subunit
VILMRAALHREGLYFPPYPFNHSIETEGLAKMASEMEAQPYGMPMLKVWHK